MTDTAAPLDEPRAPHPIVYLLLYVPYGVAFGFVTVALGWLLSHAGASVEARSTRPDRHGAGLANTLEGAACS